MGARICKDPFRLFFPLGALLGLLGVAPWLDYLYRGQAVSYPAALHRQLMIGGFMACFVVGFLTTALPRFTQAHYARPVEIVLLLLAVLTSAIGSFAGDFETYYLSQSAIGAILVFFAFNRFKHRQVNPPGVFIFIGSSLVVWTLGSFYLSLRPFGSEVFHALHFQAVILALVIGVGSRLIPGILGWSEIVTHQRAIYENRHPFLQVIGVLPLILFVFFWLSYGIEFFLDQFTGRAIRAAAVSLIAFRFWNVLKPPKLRGFLQFGIWISCWCFVLGLWAQALWPEMTTHGLHVTLIGGFSLLAFMVGLRVTLAHSALLSGEQRQSLENRSWVVLLIGGFIVAAMATRVSVYFFQRFFWSHLSYAAALWMLAAALWIAMFFWFSRRERGCSI